MKQEKKIFAIGLHVSCNKGVSAVSFLCSAALQFKKLNR